jgi:hypothetical protein
VAQNSIGQVEDPALVPAHEGLKGFAIALFASCNELFVGRFGYRHLAPGIWTTKYTPLMWNELPLSYDTGTRMKS